jgi:predicted transcriptional regulator
MDPEVLLLIKLHNFGVVRPERAISAEKISEIFKINPYEVKDSLKKLITRGCIEKSGDKYYLSIQGIIIVNSMFT